MAKTSSGNPANARQSRLGTHPVRAVGRPSVECSLSQDSRAACSFSISHRVSRWTLLRSRNRWRLGCVRCSDLPRSAQVRAL